MKLYIMRHGQAVAAASSDAERVLSEVGQNEAARVAESLQGVALDGILVSPYLRARETAQIVADVIDGPALVQSEQLTPETPAAEALEVIPDTGSWLLVAHMPLVSRLTGLLVDGRTDSGPAFQTAMIAELELEYPCAGLARLLRTYTP